MDFLHRVQKTINWRGEKTHRYIQTPVTCGNKFSDGRVGDSAPATRRAPQCDTITPVANCTGGIIHYDAQFRLVLRLHTARAQEYVFGLGAVSIQVQTTLCRITLLTEVYAIVPDAHIYEETRLSRSSWRPQLKYAGQGCSDSHSHRSDPE